MGIPGIKNLSVDSLLPSMPKASEVVNKVEQAVGKLAEPAYHVEISSQPAAETQSAAVSEMIAPSPEEANMMDIQTMLNGV